MKKTSFLKANEIKELEDNCFKNGLPVAALMEKAGLKSASLFKKLYPRNKFSKVGVFVGPGHNGADALVVARELMLSGYKTYIYLVDKKLKELTSNHLNYYFSLGGRVFDHLENIHTVDVVIDGLYGFGLNKKLEQKYINVIEIINKSNNDIIALDLPSGMHADFGNVLGACIHATHTFCLGLYKQGLIQDYSVDYIGNLHLIDIGLYNSSQLNSQWSMELPKKRNLNKFTNGVCLLFAGSNKYPGAGILCAQGALASGAGYVQLSCTEDVKYSTVSKMPDIICRNLNDSLLQIEKQIINTNFCILCGSGLDDNCSLMLIIEKINLLNKKSPCLVIDAASLNSKNYSLIKSYKGPKILTPHMGEFKKIFPRIYERMPTEICSEINPLSLNKIDAVKMAAQEINGIVLLKGPHTVIANESGEIYVDIKSTSALARAGCGDVLAGLITGLVAKGHSPFTAASLAVYKQSQSAIKLEAQFGSSAICASRLFF